MSAASPTTKATPAWVGPASLLLYLIVATALLVARLQVPSSVDVGAGKAQAGLGNFYPTERSGTHEYRWSKEVSRINTPRLSDAQQITLYLDGSRPAGFASTAISIVVNGQPAATITATNAPITYTFTYRDFSPLPQLTLELRPQHTFFPSDKDYRPLGAIFYGMRVTPAPSLFGLVWPPLLVLLIWLLIALCCYFLFLWSKVQFLGAWLLPLLYAVTWAVKLTDLLGWMSAALLLLLPITIYLNRRVVEATLARTVGWLRGWRIWRNRLARLLVVPGFYLAATIAFTWPYVTYIGSKLPGWPMDNFNFLYKIWWVSHATFGTPPPGASLVFNPNVYYPVGFNLAQGELTPANTLLTIPITATLGPIVSYNLLVFASFVLSGWGMYLLVRFLIFDFGFWIGDAPGVINDPSTTPPTYNSTFIIQNSKLIAAFIGLAYAFLPYRLNHMLGHLQMMGTQWLPFTFLYLEQMLRTRRWQHGLLAGIFFALCCWEAWYYAAIIGLFVALYFPIRWWQLRRTPRRLAGGINHAPTTPNATIMDGEQGGINHASTENTNNSNLKPQTSNLKPIIAFVGAVIVLVAPFALSYLQLRAGNSLAYSAKAANGSSALLSDYFIPSQLHPLWGNIFKVSHTANLNLTEYNLWPGAVMWGLLLVGLWVGRKWRPAGFPFGLYVMMAGLGLLLSFGLEYDLGGELSRFIPSLHSGDLRMPLPGRLLYNYLPLFSSIRAWARFGVIVLFAAYIIAALGLAWLLARPHLAPYRYTIVAALTLLLLADFWATPYTWGYSRVQPQPLDTWLAQQPSGAVVAMLPFDRATRDGPAMWASVYQAQPIAYGYETFMPNDYQRNEDTLNQFPASPALDVLKGWGVKYIAVSSCPSGSPTEKWCYGRYWPEVRDTLAANPRLRYIDHFYQPALWDGDVGLFDVRPDVAWHAVADDVYLYELK